VTDLVAIATIVSGSAACDEVAEVTRPSEEPLAHDNRATVPDAHLRPHGEGTLTEAPRSFDVAYRMPALLRSPLRVWASAAFMALTGLVVGATVALNVLSSSSSSPPAASSPPSAPSVTEPAPPPPASATALEVAASAPSAPSAASAPMVPSALPAPSPSAAAKWPRPASSAAAPPAGTRARPSIRRSFTLGI
jgi:hypothetical protein